MKKTMQILTLGLAFLGLNYQVSAQALPFSAELSQKILYQYLNRIESQVQILNAQQQVTNGRAVITHRGIHNLSENVIYMSVREIARQDPIHFARYLTGDQTINNLEAARAAMRVNTQQVQVRLLRSIDNAFTVLHQYTSNISMKTGSSRVTGFNQDMRNLMRYVDNIIESVNLNRSLNRGLPFDTALFSDNAFRSLIKTQADSALQPLDNRLRYLKQATTGKARILRNLTRIL